MKAIEERNRKEKEREDRDRLRIAESKHQISLGL